jgi:SAM-dependent methyltransferase
MIIKPEKFLHLGCGRSYKVGWVNVDCMARLKPDMVVDLTKFPWPWEDNSVDAIYSSHVFEHLPNTVETMDECHRILKPGGTLECVVPFAMSTVYMQDPTHCRPWTEATLDYFVKGTPNLKYTDREWNKVFVELESDGIITQGHPKKFTFYRFARNLIPYHARLILKVFLFGMFDQVHFKLEKP